jgi:hypothetical protein
MVLRHRSHPFVAVLRPPYPVNGFGTGRAGQQAQMSSEERQRQIREQGSRPAEAEKQEAARTGREALERSEAERSAEQASSTKQNPPLAEEDADRPTPRR